MIHEQNENIDKDRHYKREPNRNSVAEKYNSWTEKFIRSVQQPTWSGRIKNEKKQVIWNHQVRETKNGKKWREPTGLVGHYAIYKNYFYINGICI